MFILIIGILLVSLIYVGVVSAVADPNVCEIKQGKNVNSATERVMFEVSGQTNAHGKIYSGPTASVAVNPALRDLWFVVCDIIAGATETRTCSAEYGPNSQWDPPDINYDRRKNAVIALTSPSNSHGHIPQGGNQIQRQLYDEQICYGDLQCWWSSGSCDRLSTTTKEFGMYSLSDVINGHIGRFSDPYTWKVCCIREFDLPETCDNPLDCGTPGEVGNKKDYSCNADIAKRDFKVCSFDVAGDECYTWENDFETCSSVTPGTRCYDAPPVGGNDAVCATYCGNGQKNSPMNGEGVAEACDDGNTADIGDGCTNACAKEPSFDCWEADPTSPSNCLSMYWASDVPGTTKIKDFTFTPASQPNVYLILKGSAVKSGSSYSIEIQEDDPTALSEGSSDDKIRTGASRLTGSITNNNFLSVAWKITQTDWDTGNDNSGFPFYTPDANDGLEFAFKSIGMFPTDYISYNNIFRVAPPAGYNGILTVTQTAPPGDTCGINADSTDGLPGFLDDGETCDDGKHCADRTDCTDNDGCNGIGDGLCKPRSGDGCSEACIDETIIGICGDNAVYPGDDGIPNNGDLNEEQCDDGNTNNGDGCLADPSQGQTCQCAPTYIPDPTGNGCVLSSRCNDYDGDVSLCNQNGYKNSPTAINSAPGGTVCGDYGNTCPPDYTFNDCYCEYQSNLCNSIQPSSVMTCGGPGGGTTTRIGSCSITDDFGVNDCSTGIESFPYTWSGTWKWDASNSYLEDDTCDGLVPGGGAGCVDDSGAICSGAPGVNCHYDPRGESSTCVLGGSGIIVCPQQVKLFFFTWLNFVLTAMTISFIYFLLYVEKKGKGKKKK